MRKFVIPLLAGTVAGVAGCAMEPAPVRPATAAEAAAVCGSYGYVDVNNDGFISGDEWNTYRTSTGEDRYRRGLYTIWRRSSPYPSMVAFDAPDRASCVVKRPRTNHSIAVIEQVGKCGHMIAVARIELPQQKHGRTTANLRSHHHDALPTGDDKVGRWRHPTAAPTWSAPDAVERSVPTSSILRLSTLALAARHRGPHSVDHVQ